MTKKENLMRLAFLALLTLSLAACDNRAADPPLPSGDFAVVTTSGGFGAGGAVNTIRLSDHMVIEGLDTTIDQDNAVRVFGGKAYVLNRGPGSLFVYDIKSWKSPVEIPTGDAQVAHNTSDPNDLAVLPGSPRVYVTLYTEDAAHAVGVIDPANPSGVIQWIAIPASPADPDGHPEPAQIYPCDGKLYVALGDVDTTTANYAPTGPGRIAVIDPASGKTEDVITLVGQIPYQLAAESADCSDVLVADSGPYGKAPDGTAGIERVDLTAKKSLGFVLKDSDLMGRPSSVSVRSRTLAFSAIYYDLEPDAMGDMILSSTKVVAFDPSTGKLLGDVTGKASFIPFATVTPDGQLLVAVDNYAGAQATGKLGSGIYIGPADGKPLPTTPIDLGQNPYAIAFQ